MDIIVTQNIGKLFGAFRNETHEVLFVAIKQKSLLQEFRNLKVLPVSRLSQCLFDRSDITLEFCSLLADDLVDKKIVWLKRHYLRYIVLS